MGVSDLEVVCRSEAQRVLTCLRSNRKFGSLSRSWRELEEASPIRQISEWRSGGEATPAALLRPILQIVRSPHFAGPSTYVALEAAHAVAVALCEAPGATEAPAALAATLVEVSSAVCECVFEETQPQVDEATAVQMIAVLALCTTSQAAADVAAFPTGARLQAFAKVLSLWGHYRHSPTLRCCAQAALQRMLDFACADLGAQAEFMKLVLHRISSEVVPGLPTDRVLLYLRCLQRITTHPAARRWWVTEGPQASFYQDAVPLALLSIGEHFSTSISVLSLLLPIVNRTCWLCIDSWAGGEGRTPCLGALQVEALLGSVYLRAMARAAAPLQSAEGVGHGLTVEEGMELLAVILEALCDLLREDAVRTLWASFDADWRRPALLEQVVQRVTELFRDSTSTERPLPAHLVHLSSTVLTRIVSAFCGSGAGARPKSGPDAVELARIQEQWRYREAVENFMAQLEEKPKKGRAVLEKSGLLALAPLPPGHPGSPTFEEWAQKLGWILRCLNHRVPYAAMGEFFGQPTPESEHAFAAFVDTFDWGAADIDEALRGFLQAFLLPKEAQQIDRVLKIFAHAYYRKHMEHCQNSGAQGAGYLKHPDAAYTLAFSVIMLNTDQHNPKLKRRMTLKDFLSNNRGINEGENIPEEVQMRIFESIHHNEVKTPSSGSLTEGVSPARWTDFMQLVRRGYRDNSLLCLHADLDAVALGAHARAFLERMGERLRTALEHALASDAGAHSDAMQGLEHLLRLTVECELPEADNVAEGLFFFSTEVFHEQPQRAALGRAAACLRALFGTALARLTGMSTKQLHLLVYLTAQFALYGLFERALPPADPITAKLLRAPSLAVDPPTGVVYSFLRKISTAPFKMLSYAEEGGGVDDRKAKPPTGSPRSSGSAPGPGGVAGEGTPGAEGEEAEGTPPEAKAEEASEQMSEESPGEPGTASEPLLRGQKGSPPPSETDEASLHDDPLRPQIEKAFETCDLDAFVKALVELWRPQEPVAGEDGGPTRPPAKPIAGEGAIQMFLCYLSSLFLALRTPASGKVAKDQDLPWWPDPPAWPNMAAPQGLQLPKRALALNVLDGYETLRLALRLTTATVGSQGPMEGGAQLWNVASMQELSVCAHVGLFHTLRRSDLCERTLRLAVAGVFQVAATLLTLQTDEGFVVSVGWPTRLVKALLRRAEGEPQLLVPTARLCLEAVRSFVVEVTRVRVLDRIEVWKALLLLLLKAAPTPARALWPGTKDREVEAIQNQIWRQGIVWLLAHPQLLDCLGVLESSSAAQGGPSEGSAFWAWALSELGALAQEVAAGTRPTAVRLLLEAYGTLLGSIARVQDPEEYAAQDELVGGEASPAAGPAQGEDSSGPASSPGSGAVVRCPSNRVLHRGPPDAKQLTVLSASWSRVAISLLSYVGPALARGGGCGDDPELQPVPVLKQAMLNVRVPPLLSASEYGPYWARLVLEKLVSVLTGAVTNGGAPLAVVRDAVALVAKFFLQNLPTLQRHECFGQLWLMVLRLMLLFIKRGSDDRDAELEEIATEALKNLLCVLLGTKLLGFVAPKEEAAGAGPPGEVKIWWQMTWDCIEVFLPGFGEEFSRFKLPDDEAEGGKAAEALCVPMVSPGAGRRPAHAELEPKAAEEAIMKLQPPPPAPPAEEAVAEAVQEPQEPQRQEEAAPAAAVVGEAEEQVEPVAQAAPAVAAVDEAEQPITQAAQAAPAAAHVAEAEEPTAQAEQAPPEVAVAGEADELAAPAVQAVAAA